MTSILKDKRPGAKARRLANVKLGDDERGALNRMIVTATADLSPTAARDLIREQKSALLRAFGMGSMQPARRSRQRGMVRAGTGSGMFNGAAAPPEVAHQSVYVIGAVGHPTKIGIALDPMDRLRDLQVGCPHRLRLYFSVPVPSGARNIERACHQRLSDHRVSGEWFSIDADTAIETVRRMIAERT